MSQSECRHPCASTGKGVGTCQHIQVPGQVPTYLWADTSMCRHVLTYECYLEAGMCWQVSAPGSCQHLRRCRHVPTRADSRDISHMDLIWMPGCAGICQHLLRCRHLQRCRHLPTHQGAGTGAFTFSCRHIYVPTHADIWMLFGSWDVLTCSSDITAHPSLQIKKSIWLVSQVSARVSTWMCRHVPACVSTFPGVGTFSGADTCQHIPASK